MKRDKLIAISAIALSLTTSSRGDVIFNNFGSGDTYILDQGYDIVDGVPWNLDLDQGSAFTVSGGDFYLDSIELAMGLVFGQNRVFIDVYLSIDGLPGFVMDSAVIEDQMVEFGGDNPPIVALFDGSTVLLEGLQYFVIASSDTESWLAWNENNQDDSGPHAVRQDLGDWTVYPDDTRGTYRVNGTLVPAPGLLVLLGMAGLVTRRRRRKA